MTAKAEAIKTQLDQLAPDDRAELASYLIGSLDLGEDPDAEAAWKAELTRRAEEIHRGEASGEAAASVFSRLRARFS